MGCSLRMWLSATVLCFFFFFICVSIVASEPCPGRSCSRCNYPLLMNGWIFYFLDVVMYCSTSLHCEFVILFLLKQAVKCRRRVVEAQRVVLEFVARIGLGSFRQMASVCTLPFLPLCLASRFSLQLPSMVQLASLGIFTHHWFHTKPLNLEMRVLVTDTVSLPRSSLTVTYFVPTSVLNRFD